MTSLSKSDDSIQDQTNRETVNISTGSGIAIAFIWICCTCLTIFLAVFSFTDVITPSHTANEISDQAPKERHEDSYAIAMIISILLCASPMIAAYKATSKFIGGSD